MEETTTIHNCKDEEEEEEWMGVVLVGGLECKMKEKGAACGGGFLIPLASSPVSSSWWRDFNVI